MIKVFGYDGLWTDETAARYTSDGKGGVIREHWGSRETITPEAAVAELTSAYQAQERCTHDPLGPARLRSIQRTIDSIQALIVLSH